MFIIEGELYIEIYNSTYDSELNSFNENYEHAENKSYFIATAKRDTLNKISRLNSVSGGLAQFTSQIKNEIELDRRKTPLQIVKDYCNKNNLDLALVIKQVAEIMAMYEVYDAISKVNHILISKPNKKINASLTKSITIAPERISELHTELSNYFAESESTELIQTLNGNNIGEKITFQFNGNRLVELFRRLHYNGCIADSKASIEKWIILNFKFRNESQKETQDFKKNTVHATLYGVDGAQPKKSQRILCLDWLPYKSPDQIRKSK